MPDSQFWWGVGASLAAALIAFLLVQLRTRVLLSWGKFSLFWSITKRLKDTGVTNFFTNRSDYVNFRRNRSISDYIATAKKELIYLGFWLAQGIEIESIQNTIRGLLTKGHTVELIFLDAELDLSLKSRIAACLGISPESLHTRLVNSWSDMRSFRNALPDEIKPRFILRSHQEHISSSAFVFDHGTEYAKTLVDFKIYGAGRESSFGIELKPVKLDKSLYARITDSFLEIKRESSVALPSEKDHRPA